MEYAILNLAISLVFIGIVTYFNRQRIRICERRLDIQKQMIEMREEYSLLLRPEPRSGYIPDLKDSDDPQA